jgi:hypothetical protein
MEPEGQFPSTWFWISDSVAVGDPGYAVRPPICIVMQLLSPLRTPLFA